MVVMVDGDTEDTMVDIIMAMTTEIGGLDLSKTMVRKV